MFHANIRGGMRVGEANMATLYYFLNFYGKLNSKNIVYLKWKIEDFPGGPVVKNPPSNAEDMDLIGSGKKSDVSKKMGEIWTESMVNSLLSMFVYQFW